MAPSRTKHYNGNEYTGVIGAISHSGNPLIIFHSFLHVKYSTMMFSLYLYSFIVIHEQGDTDDREHIDIATLDKLIQ